MKKYLTFIFTIFTILLIYSIIKNIEFLPHKYQIFIEEIFNFCKIATCLWTAHTFIKYKTITNQLIIKVKALHPLLYWTAKIMFLPSLLIGSFYLSFLAIVHFYHVVTGTSCLTISDIQTNLSFHLAFIVLILSVKMFALICFYTWIDKYGSSDIRNLSNTPFNR